MRAVPDSGDSPCAPSQLARAAPVVLSCWGCGVGGCSPLWVSPEPQGFLTLGWGFAAARGEAGAAGAEGSACWQGLGLVGLGPSIRRNPGMV